MVAYVFAAMAAAAVTSSHEMLISFISSCVTTFRGIEWVANVPTVRLRFDPVARPTSYSLVRRMRVDQNFFAGITHSLTL